MYKTRKIILLFLLLVLVFSLVGTGYSEWQFSGDAETEETVELSINSFNFNPKWENEDCLDAQTHAYADELLEAINNMLNQNHAAGQALLRAFWSTNDWYIGNVDLHHNVYLNLKKVLHVTDDCRYIISRNYDGSFDLYVTYVNFKNYNYGDRIGPVYNTHYQFVNDKYYAVSSCVGTSLVTTYDYLELQFQKSINPATFIKNN